MGSLNLHHLSRGHALLYSLKVHFAENLNASMLSFQYSLDHRSSETTLGINLGGFYIWHRGKKKKKEKMGHHNLDIVQLKERSQVSQR